MYDATNNTPYGSGLTYVNEVRKRIVYILDNVIVIFYSWLSDAATKFQSGLCKHLPPIAATYYV